MLNSWQNASAACPSYPRVVISAYAIAATVFCVPLCYSLRENEMIVAVRDVDSTVA